jgi:hypothetical protein
MYALLWWKVSGNKRAFSLIYHRSVNLLFLGLSLAGHVQFLVAQRAPAFFWAAGREKHTKKTKK